MEGFSGNGSYQNGAPSKEAEFQRLAQNIGSNIQKIIQNGKGFYHNTYLDIFILDFSGFEHLLCLLSTML